MPHGAADLYTPEGQWMVEPPVEVSRLGGKLRHSRENNLYYNSIGFMGPCESVVSVCTLTLPAPSGPSCASQCHTDGFKNTSWFI